MKRVRIALVLAALSVACAKRDDETLGARINMPGITLQAPKGEFTRSDVPGSVVLQSTSEPRWNLSVTPHKDTNVSLAELKDLVTSAGSGIVYQIVYLGRLRDQAAMAPVFEASARGIVLGQP